MRHLRRGGDTGIIDYDDWHRMRMRMLMMMRLLRLLLLKMPEAELVVVVLASDSQGVKDTFERFELIPR